MKFDIITACPKIFTGFLTESIVKSAIESKLVEITIHNLRDYSLAKHKKIDDKPYGGEAGMVLMIEPVANCIRALQRQVTYDEVIYMSPEGEILNQKMANSLSLKSNFIVICGHYKGIDERIRDLFVTKEVSMGNYVLSGGEIPAAVLVDSVVRLVPGVISDGTSALNDSFQDGLISYPVYTRPANFEGNKAPEVLLSGNHHKISEWKIKNSIKKTKEKRPLLDSPFN